jgi:hypothetical protein
MSLSMEVVVFCIKKAFKQKVLYRQIACPLN